MAIKGHWKPNARVMPILSSPDFCKDPYQRPKWKNQHPGHRFLTETSGVE